MSNIFVTSDHHFGHANVIRYSRRPFNSAQEMDREMIARWNDVVKNDDTVYHLGDFSFRKDIYELFNLLNGRIFWLCGNHDEKRYDNVTVPAHVTKLGHYKELNVYNNTFVLCHYPFHTWNKSHYNSNNLHGHCHGGLDKTNSGMRRYDVGVDAEGNDFYPQNIKDILVKLDKRGSVESYNTVQDI